MNKLKAILAEKPDQARKLAAPFKSESKKGFIYIYPCSTFKEGAYVVWAIGHLCSLSSPESYKEEWKDWRLETLPMIPEQFKHEVVKEKAAHFKIVKEKLSDSKVNEIIIATDPAREGEYIARIIIQMAGIKKPIKRLWNSSLTANSIKKAFDNLVSEEKTKPLYHEALARSYSDWLVGMNTSRAYTILLRQKGIKETFSTGRVQTPLLSLIARRMKEIGTFEPKNYYEIIAHFLIANNEYTGKYFNGKEYVRFNGNQDALAIVNECKNQNATITEMTTERKNIAPPLLFSLSSLQAKANEKFKLAPAKTLEIVQSLYEHGYVSYPRSDSNYVTKEEALEFPKILLKLKNVEKYKDIIVARDISDNKRFVDESKVSDHYAIIPTDQVPKMDSLSDDESKIYDLIARSLIAAHYDAAVIDQTTLITQVKNHQFKTTGRQIIEEGWRKILFEQEKEVDEDNKELPLVQQSDTGIVKDIEAKKGTTKPPKPYTEGQLITLMKTAGKTIDNKDLENELGQKLSSVGIGTEATRAGIIQTLKVRNYIEVKKNQVFVTPKGQILVDAVEDTILSSVELTAQWEHYLSKIGQGKASGQNFINKSKELAEKLVKDAITQSKNWQIAKLVDEMKKEDVLGPCPKCNKDIVDKGKFFGCTGYKENNCNFTIPKSILGKSISQTNVTKLLTKGKTNLIKGFKDGKFDAYLTWKEKSKGETTFEFVNKNK